MARSTIARAISVTGSRTVVNLGFESADRKRPSMPTTEMSDGTMVPHMNIFEIEDGTIRRARVYTDKPTHDGVDIDQFADDINPTSR